MKVREIQQRLKDLGYKIEVDGILGKDTKATIKQFQTDTGLEPDGIAGPITQAAMNGEPVTDSTVGDEHYLSAKSLARLVGVHPKKVKIVKRASVIAKARGLGIAVNEGVRTRERQRELYAKGRTEPGRKVTWTMNSKHMLQDCGYGVAVDVLPDPFTGWDDKKPFILVGECMNQAALDCGYETIWGYDWDDDSILNEKGEYDGPHHELADGEY